ncbi:hypothetical protein EYF80_020559 [Liparis tanakae]|uniref:Uncharacterized protein n=1 Tax=Liparis tanakae TaxID=230148 RepID=A0A4Z2HWH7_9TELE|nr:hypothetical protein EYF80_020559 [Liparis tanakae]
MSPLTINSLIMVWPISPNKGFRKRTLYRGHGMRRRGKALAQASSARWTSRPKRGRPWRDWRVERTYRKPACSSLPRKLVPNKDSDRCFTTFPAERQKERDPRKHCSSSTTSTWPTACIPFVVTHQHFLFTSVTQSRLNLTGSPELRRTHGASNHPAQRSSHQRREPSDRCGRSGCRLPVGKEVVCKPHPPPSPRRCPWRERMRELLGKSSIEKR